MLLNVCTIFSTRILVRSPWNKQQLFFCRYIVIDTYNLIVEHFVNIEWWTRRIIVSIKYLHFVATVIGVICQIWHSFFLSPFYSFFHLTLLSPFAHLIKVKMFFFTYFWNGLLKHYENFGRWIFLQDTLVSIWLIISYGTRAFFTI